MTEIKMTNRGFLIGNNTTWTDLQRRKELEEQIEFYIKQKDNCDDSAHAEQLQTRINQLKQQLVNTAFI